MHSSALYDGPPACSLSTVYVVHMPPAVAYPVHVSELLQRVWQYSSSELCPP